MLLQHGNTLIVSVSVTRGTMVPQPAHIHTGHCAKIGGVVYPLSNVVSGKSTTTIRNVSLASVETGDFAINIHKSAEDIGTYVSCGEIPRI